MKESDRQRLVLQLSRGDVRLFRNNTGKFWAGEHTRLKDGSVLIRNTRLVECGLCVGSSDLIGWVSHTITAADVGRTVAVFAAVEVKSDAGRVSPAQATFLRVVSQMGGLSGAVRSEDEARLILDPSRRFIL